MGTAPPTGFTVWAGWFEPDQGDMPARPVGIVDDLRRQLAPLGSQRLWFAWVGRDGGDRGLLAAHVTGDRAFLCHMDVPGGIDSYCHDPGDRQPDELIGVVMPNGQVDQNHRGWTVSRAAGLRALERFLTHGDRDPSLVWVEQPESLDLPPAAAGPPS